MNTLEVYVLRGDAYELTVRARADQTIASPALDGLTFDTARIFAD